MTQKSITVEALQRKLDIEAALECVRARSLAMTSSDELSDVLSLLFQQFDLLGIHPKTAWLTLWNPEENTFTYRSTGISGLRIQGQQVLGIDGMDIWKDLYEKWKNDTSESVEVLYYSGEDLKQLFTLMEDTFSAMPPEERLTPEHFPQGGYSVQGHCKFGYIGYTHTREPSEEEKKILTRFGIEFGRIYQRFLDIEKAEAHAREAQIEAALARVRARSMAMHHSEELGEVAAVLFEQLNGLVGELWTCGFVLCEKGREEDEWWLSMDEGFTRGFFLPNEGDYTHATLYEGWEQGDDFRTVQLEGDSLQEHYDWLMGIPTAQKIFEDMEASGITRPEWQKLHAAYFSKGYLCIITEVPCEEEDVFKRFAQAFDLAYTRFLDLKKAEAQAREAQIEAALERVRTRTMAMHKSVELGEVAAVLFHQIESLGATLERLNIGIIREEEEIIEWWSTEQGGRQIDHLFKGSIHEPTTISKVYAAWKDGLKKLELDQTGDELKQWIYYVTEVIGLPFEPEFIQERRVHSAAFFEHGALLVSTPEPLPRGSMDLLERFSAVFEQTYTRFLDLQKAEQQTREAEIEAALERVRAKTMAMHNSQDVGDTVITLFQEVMKLGLDDSIRCGIGILEGYEGMETWSANSDKKGKVILKMGMLNMSIHPMLIGLKKAWKKGDKAYSYHFAGADVFKYYTALNMEPEYPIHVDLNTLPDNQFANIFFFTEGILFAFTQTQLTKEARRVLERFASVFGQTYRRYLDLLKAEAQAWEAQIEAALERVRARSMAMHTSDELLDLSVVLFQELDKLGVRGFFNCGFVEIDEERQEQSGWTTMTDGSLGEGYYLPLKGDPVLDARHSAWKKGVPVFLQKVSGKELEDHMAFAMPTLGSDRIREMTTNFPDPTYFYCFNFSQGYLSIITGENLSEEAESILIRFTRAFEQAYIRFMDLKKAEAQAREAQIEAALERVRAKTMAMHNTEDIAATVTTFFNELLGLDPDTSMRCGVGILSQSEHMELWTASIRDGTQTVLDAGTLDMSLHPLLKGVRESWVKKKRGFSYTLKGKDLKQYFKILNDAPEYPASFNLKATPKIVYHNSLFFRDGVLFVFTEAPLQNDIRDILERFAAVFGQTYTRYLDLQHAEERAREAVKQASIERVRGEISSMRSTADLQRITPLIWNELTTLGVPFFRCGVFIVDEKEKKIHSYLSNPMGESLAVWQVDFGLIPVFDEMVKSWQKGEVFLTEWDRQGFIDFSELLTKHGLVDDRERYQSGMDAPDHLVLHMVPFAQGMLYVGSQANLDTGQMELVQSLANAFSVAYARYEDFKQLEKTLADLKATQAQLIQSEKMASLGELTAGIAHEIKNPLNFVNNFSDVTRELVEEMIEELKKGDMEEADAIARDVMQNLEKIVHHGSRADSIVKGMLQHSRSSDGQKESTDLNELADEYLRLAYHGLRAKDKAFNASMNTDFDETIEKMELVPQDIGRVLLNLITNAFHAVNERKVKEGQEYDPAVWVQTKNNSSGVTITVRDNGGGIPLNIKDKIFQPFFTTKPTGQGTGLGLSLSYDIVKAHGGEITVVSEEGKGTEFKINLPVS